MSRTACSRRAPSSGSCCGRTTRCGGWSPSRSGSGCSRRRSCAWRSGARATTISPEAAASVLAATGTSLAEPERVANVARRPGVSLSALLAAAHVPVAYPDEIVASAEVELKYDGYLAREREAAARLAELASFALPADLPYPEFKSLATEARQKLGRVRPTSLAQAARIPGVSPSDLHNLVIETTRWRRRVA